MIFHIRISILPIKLLKYASLANVLTTKSNLNREDVPKTVPSLKIVGLKLGFYDDNIEFSDASFILA